MTDGDGKLRLQQATATVINEATWARGSFGKMAKTRRSIATGKGRADMVCSLG